MKLVGEGLLMSEVVRPEAQIIVMFLLQKKQKKNAFSDCRPYFSSDCLTLPATG